MSENDAREQPVFTSNQRKNLFLERANHPEGTTPAEVHRAAIEQGDTVTEEAYYNIARRLVHRGLLAPFESSGASGAVRYTIGAPAQSQWLEEDDLGALIDPDYPLLAITIWKESQRQINEIPEGLWVELRERLRNRPATELFLQAILSYCGDFHAQVAALADPLSYGTPKTLADAKQEAENGCNRRSAWLSWWRG